VIIVFYLHLRTTSAAQKDRTAWEVILSLDPLGLLLFVPAVVCILLALQVSKTLENHHTCKKAHKHQWGGTDYPWNSGRIIALFVISGILLVAFVLVQSRNGENATVPARIGLQRTVWASSLFIFCLFSAFFLLIYFLPIYFQAIHNLSPSASGVASIPLILSNVISIAITGGLITKFGFYVPYVYLCIVLTCIGCGLITTLDVHSGTAKWIGYQLLYGFGVGCALQIPNVATQNVLPLEDIPTGLAIVILAQNFGPAVMLSAGNNILNQKLVEYIAELDIEGFDPRAVLRAGATGFRNVVPEGYLESVLEAYNLALRQTFYLTLAMSCAAVVGGVFIEWKSVKNSGVREEEAVGSSDEGKDV
jgi:MFS family permease